MKISMYTTYITPPTLYAIIQSGNKEIITPQQELIQVKNHNS